MDERHKLWSTSLAVVHLDRNQLEYCQTGDALILFIFNDGNYKVITPDIDIDRNTLLLWKEMQVAPDTFIQDVLAEQIHKIRLEMNISYGVLNGEPEALDFIRHGYENLTDVRDILLFTDGLQLPRENPQEEHDWQTFVQLYKLGGLQAVRDHVRHLQQQEPLRYVHRGSEALYEGILHIAISFVRLSGRVAVRFSWEAESQHTKRPFRKSSHHSKGDSRCKTKRTLQRPGTRWRTTHFWQR